MGTDPLPKFRSNRRVDAELIRGLTSPKSLFLKMILICMILLTKVFFSPCILTEMMLEKMSSTKHLCLKILVGLRCE